MLLVAFLLLAPFALPAAGQPGATEELFHRLEVEGGDAGDQAAFELFKSGTHDARLRAVLTNRSGTAKKEARLCILRALKFSERSRRLAACSLVQEALDDPVPEVQSQAVATFATLDSDETYDYIAQSLARLRWALAETAGGKQARALIEVLERLRNPQRACRVLIEVLAGRLNRDLEQRVRETLERLTSQRYASPSEWRAWWARVEGLSLTEWRREVAQERAKLLRRIEGTAEDLYARLLAARHDQPDLLLAELKRGLSDETVPAVTKRAIHELGRLARVDDPPHPAREAAVAALRDRLKQGASSDYNELRAHVLLALGRSRDPLVLPDLLGYLAHNAPRMRAAAATALGSLGDARAIEPLLRQLDHEDAELVEAVVVALGEIRQNPPVEAAEDGSGAPDVPVSDVLVRFASALMNLNGTAGPAANDHLARTAEALGKLPYPDAATDPGPGSRAVALLVSLAGYPADPNVRNSAVTALGLLRHADVFPALVRRLDQEPEAHVRKAVLDAIGRQGLDDPSLAPQAVARLVPFLFSTAEQDAALRRKSQQRLEELARGGAGFAGLELVVDTLLKSYEERAARQAALGFLLLLPAPDALGSLDDEARLRYHRLVWRRADCYLGSGDAVSALRDYEAAQSGLKLHTTDAIDDATLPLFLGKGRALLGLDPPRPAAAFEQLWGCLRHVSSQEAPDAEAAARIATLALDALQGVRGREPERVAELAGRLEPLLEKAPAELRQRLAAVREGR